MGVPGIIVHTKCTCLGQSSWIGLFSLKKKNIHLLLAVLSLCCSVRTSLVEVSGGYSLIEVCRLLIVLASPVAEHKISKACRFQ